MDDDTSRRSPRWGPRLPLLAAALIALIGVTAFGVAILPGRSLAAGGAPVGVAVPLTSTATPAPGAGWAAPGRGMFGAGIGPMGIGRGPGAGPMAGAITITAISGTDLSLKTADGWTRTIDGSGATVTKGGQTVSFSALQVGDQVTFRETRQSDGTYKINLIAVVQPHLAGTVTAVDTSSLTLQQADGTSSTINLTSTTTYRLAGQSSTASALATGEQVMVQGSVASDGTFTASTVDILPARAVGVVSAKTTNSITVTDRSGHAVTVDVGSSTSFQVSGVSNATLANVTVGATIAASGTRNADGSLNATVVRVLPAGQSGVGPMGGRGMRGAWGPGAGNGQPPAPPSGTGSSSGA
ncbi:MAG: DUF5666 domain-containing protein [Candidatus Limnocylindrales bacterium]